MTGRPRSRGSSRCSTDAKNASASACSTNICSVMLPELGSGVAPPEQERERQDGGDREPGSQRNPLVRADVLARRALSEDSPRRRLQRSELILAEDGAARGLRGLLQEGTALRVRVVVRVDLVAAREDPLVRRPDVDEDRRDPVLQRAS